MAAHEVSVKRFGFPTRLLENPVTNAIGVSAEPILAPNPDRVFWLIVNLSTNVVYIGFEQDVSATKGIWLDANGGWASMAVDEDGEAVAYGVYGLAAGAGSAIYVIAIEKA